MQKRENYRFMTLANGYEKGAFDPSWLMGIPIPFKYFTARETQLVKMN